MRAFTSRAQIPLKDVAVTITEADGSAIAMRLTNRSGILDAPIELTVPDRSASLSPNSGITPYRAVNIYARKEDFEEIYIKNVQVFANTITEQPLQLIPLAEFPGQWNKAEEYITSAQNL